MSGVDAIKSYYGPRIMPLLDRSTRLLEEMRDPDLSAIERAQARADFIDNEERVLDLLDAQAAELISYRYDGSIFSRLKSWFA